MSKKIATTSPKHVAQRPKREVDVSYTFFSRRTPTKRPGTKRGPPSEWDRFYKEGLFAAHRLVLLRETPACMEDLKRLNALVAGLVDFAILGSPMPRQRRHEKVVEGVVLMDETDYREYRRVCHAFERKWRVIVEPWIDGRTRSFDEMFFEDSMYPRFPVVLEATIPSQVAALVDVYPGRFVVIDTEFFWDEIRPYLDEAASGRLRKRGEKVREFDILHREQFVRDIEMLRADPRKASDYQKFYDTTAHNADMLLRDLKTRMRKLRKLVTPTTCMSKKVTSGIHGKRTF